MNNKEHVIKEVKEVIAGIYETSKMRLEIKDQEVSKLFKPRSGYRQRYRHEKEALIRMQQVDNIPQLLRFEDSEALLIMSRMPGSSVTALSEQNLLDLTAIVNNMLAVGVARHSMPIRDILVDETGLLSLVDFERSTICDQRWRLDWIVAKRVTQYHLSRLIEEYQPQMLTPEQQQQLEKAKRPKNIFNVFKRIRKYIRN